MGRTWYGESGGWFTIDELSVNLEEIGEQFPDESVKIKGFNYEPLSPVEFVYDEEINER